MKSVLMVCMGNICRSPVAEGIARLRAREWGLDLTVDSAGTHGYHVGAAPDPRSVAVAKRRGIDLSGLRARRLTAADGENFDLILVMDDRNHRDALAILPPHTHHKVHLILKWTPHCGYTHVPDPYYGTVDDFELMIDLLWPAVSAALTTL